MFLIGSFIPVLARPAELVIFPVIVLVVFSKAAMYNKALAEIMSLLKKGR